MAEITNVWAKTCGTTTWITLRWSTKTGNLVHGWSFGLHNVQVISLICKTLQIYKVKCIGEKLKIYIMQSCMVDGSEIVAVVSLSRCAARKLNCPYNNEYWSVREKLVSRWIDVNTAGQAAS